MDEAKDSLTNEVIISDEDLEELFAFCIAQSHKNTENYVVLEAHAEKKGKSRGGLKTVVAENKGQQVVVEKEYVKKYGERPIHDGVPKSESNWALRTIMGAILVGGFTALVITTAPLGLVICAVVGAAVGFFGATLWDDLKKLFACQAKLEDEAEKMMKPN